MITPHFIRFLLLYFYVPGVPYRTSQVLHCIIYNENDLIISMSEIDDLLAEARRPDRTTPQHLFVNKHNFRLQLHSASA
jgi:hypothetical protein